MSIGLGLMAGATALGGVASSIANYQSAKYATDANVAMNRENNQFNANEAALQREFSATEAQKVRDYETQMSNTQYQRAFADAEAAGINPVAALLGSSGASTPSASTASGYAAQSSGFAGAKAADFSPLSQAIGNISYLVTSAMKIKQYEAIIGKNNVYDFTKAMTNSKTAKAVATLSKATKESSWDDLMSELEGLK